MHGQFAFCFYQLKVIKKYTVLQKCCQDYPNTKTYFAWLVNNPIWLFLFAIL